MKQNRDAIQAPATTHLCEVDVSEGLEEIALDEIRARVKVARIISAARGVVQFSFAGDLRALLKLRTVQAAYITQHYNVARPKALLGDEHFRKLLALIEVVRGLHPVDAFSTLFINAAGSDSSVMTRLKQELAARTGLAAGGAEGDLLVRIRAAQDAGGWDVLVRISPRPLATRAWRVCNFEGALNGAVAHAIITLTRPSPRDAYFNLACGSGTLLAERLAHSPARYAIGCDIDPRALDCARANLSAGGYARRAQLLRADARAIPLPDRCMDAITADLPFGHLVGSHAENVRNYPRILGEAARVARPGARFALITHEVKLTEHLLSQSNAWKVERVLRVELGGLFPRVFVLRRETGD
jgi:23S rRNA G2445 N2-methylase RlmL